MSFFHALLGSGGSVEATTEVQDRFGSALVLSLDTSLLGMMWQQDLSGGPAITPVASDTNPIGLIQDVSPNAHTITASSSTLRPVLGSSAEVNSYMTCDGTSDVLTVTNSKSCFRNIVGASPSFSIMVKFKFGSSTNGVIQGIISCNGQTAGRTGFHLGRSTGNKLTFLLTTNGAPNITMATITSSVDYLEADGWICVVIDVDGAGTNKLSLYKNNGSAQQVNVTAGYDQDFTDLVTFFKNSNDTSSRFKGDFAQCIILNRPSTSADRLWFQTYNPARTTTLKPAILESHYDFSDLTSTWQDTGRSSQASANNDPIRLADNLVDSNCGGTLSRDATAPSDAKRPILKTNVQNGRSGAQYDGDVTFQELNFQPWTNGGVWTFYLVLRNRDTVEGTKFLSDGAAGATTGTIYCTQTAEDDASNTPPVAGFGTVAGDPYFISHPGGAAYGIKSSGRNDTVNIYAFVINGTSVNVYNGDKTELTFTTTGSWNYRKLGGIAGTWTQGDWYEILRYSGKHTSAQAGSKIDELKTKWGMS